MSQENVSFLGALWRFISFYKLRKALGLARAADAQFTSSAAGVADAFDIHRDRLITEFNEFLSALTAVEGAIEDKRMRRDSLAKQKETAEKALKGAVATYGKAETAGDTAKMEEAKTAGQGFRAEVKRLEGEIGTLDADIAAQEANLKGLEDKLGEMKSEIDKLPQDKANAIADFVSNQKLAEAYKRLNGLKTTLDRGPIDAVLEKNKQLAAEARVTARVTGAATRDKTKEYIEAGATDDVEDDFMNMVNARKAEKGVNTGEAPAKSTDDREKI